MNGKLTELAHLVDQKGSICIKRTEPKGRGRTPSYKYSMTIEMEDRHPIQQFGKFFGTHTGVRKKDSTKNKPTVYPTEVSRFPWNPSS